MTVIGRSMCRSHRTPVQHKVHPARVFEKIFNIGITLPFLVAFFPIIFHSNPNALRLFKEWCYVFIIICLLFLPLFVYKYEKRRVRPEDYHPRCFGGHVPRPRGFVIWSDYGKCGICDLAEACQAKQNDIGR